MDTQNTTNQLTPTQVSEPRNFLITFLLSMLGGYFGLRNFYLGEKNIGWTRFGLFVGGAIVSFLGAMTGGVVFTLLGYFAVLTSIIWAIIDFFVVYLSVKTDANNQPLVATHRDMVWAKAIFWVTIIVTPVYIVVATLAAFYNESSTINDFDGDSLDSYQSY